MLPQAELEQLHDRLEHDGSKVPSSKLTRKYLKLVRVTGVRQSESVCKYGGIFLAESSKSVSREELYDILEQVSIAAMDCGMEGLALECISKLEDAFPTSVRVGRLRGMFLEMQGKFELAKEKYNLLLKKDPENHMIHRRLCGLAKTRGDVPGAIDACIEYLKCNAVDRQGWEELADMYTSQGMYKQAAFCMEERLLLDPFSGSCQRKYADLLYTVGGLENLTAALKYYSAAVKFSNGKDLRALYGICLCKVHLLTAKNYHKNKEDDELFRLAAELIKKTYRAENKNGKYEIVKAILD